MKKSIAGSLLALGIVSGLQASDSEVKAEITKHCIILDLADTVNFNEVNPLTQHGQVVGAVNDNSNNDGHMSIGVKCTKGTPMTTTLTSSNNWKMKNGSEEIAYDIKRKWSFTEIGIKEFTTTGVGNGDQVTDKSLFFTIDKSMKPGTYTDVVTTTFTW